MRLVLNYDNSLFHDCKIKTICLKFREEKDENIDKFIGSYYLSFAIKN